MEVVIVLWIIGAFFLGLGESIDGTGEWTPLKTICRLNPIYWILRLIFGFLWWIGNAIEDLNNNLGLW